MFRFFLLLLIPNFSMFSYDNHEISFPISSPEEIAANNLGYYIGNCVNPLTGQIYLKNVDSIAKGKEEIHILRSYVAPLIKECYSHDNFDDKTILYDENKKNHRGWLIFPEIYLKQGGYARSTFTVSLANGLNLEFHYDMGKWNMFPQSSGLTNFSNNSVSGKNDLRNIRFSSPDLSHILIQMPDGTSYYYEYSHKCPLFLLKKKNLPNGKKLKYFYEDIYLRRIESVDPSESHVYSYLNIQGSIQNHNISMITNTGKKVSYSYDIKTEKIERKTKKRHDISYLKSFPFLINAQTESYYFSHVDYSNRFLIENIYGKEENFHCEYSSVNGYSRIKKLFIKSGSDDNFYPVYEFSYLPPIPGKKEGSTTVTKSDGSFIQYFFNKNLLITKVAEYDINKICQKQTVYTWNNKQYLSSMELLDGKNALIQKTSYQYDNFGNPTVEVFSGHLCNNKEIDSYTINRQFSNDGFNLLLKEENEDGLVTYYKYLPQTNLLLSKIQSYKNQGNEKIFYREFYSYDSCNNLIKKITDDGISENSNDLQGMTERKITNYTLRQTEPFRHMIEWEEEKYWDNNEEKLLKKVHYFYDSYGYICQEDHYDAKAQFCYSIHKTYNSRGDLLKETNPLGLEASYTYTNLGELATKENFSHKLHTQFFYDKRGRKIKEIETNSNKQIHEQLYCYDLHDHLVKHQDFLKNFTTYKYNGVQTSPCQIIYPPKKNLFQNKLLTIKTIIDFDVLGKETRKVDANGNVTYTIYNAYASPLEILYPDQTKETFTYYKNGNLHVHTNPDELQIEYFYDIQNRIIEKRYLSSQKLLAKEEFLYNTFHKTSQSNRENLITTFKYDKAGRKISEKSYDRETLFFYDPLGRLSQVIQNNSLITFYTYDYLNRFSEEKKTDALGNVQYLISYYYDEDNNKNKIIKNVQNTTAISQYEYDGFKRLISFTDPLGNTTSTYYEETLANDLNQNLLKIISVNPKGTVTEKTFDAHFSKIKEEIKNSTNTTISLKEWDYDANDNKLQERDFIYLGDVLSKTFVSDYFYNNRNLLEKFSKASNASNPRVIFYKYTPSGLIKEKVLPNKISLFYKYDFLGKIENIHSSDQTINHSFLHNKEGYLLEANDLNQKLFIQRSLDPFGNVLEETYGNIKITKTYDYLNRPVTMKLMDGSTIVYNYDGSNLSSIQKITSDGNVSYTQDFAYDLNGNLIKETLPNSLGTVLYNYNLNSQRKELSSPYLQENCEYDEIGNLKEVSYNNEPYAYQYDELSQLKNETFHSTTKSYSFDSHYNPVRSDISVNELDELQTFENYQCEYDADGNLIKKASPQETSYYRYNALNQLIHASLTASEGNKEIDFIYDPLGRKLQKTTTDSYQIFLFDGFSEIGSIQDGQLNELRILYPSPLVEKTLAIELQGTIYSTLIDYRGNIRTLVDIHTQKVQNYDYSAFKEISSEKVNNPWRYASKRYDPDLKLIDYGKRYYDPALERWVSEDPAGYIDCNNLYAYLLNNPLRYTDPDGRFVFLLPLVGLIFEASMVTATYVGWGVAVGLASYALYQGTSMLADTLQHSSFESKTLEYCKPPVQYVIDAKEKAKKQEKENKEKGQKPPYDGKNLGNDPKKCPGEGFEWRGKDIETGEGNWYNPETGESLHPDLNHPTPTKPHWDYNYPGGGKGQRINIDGTWENKL